MIKKKIRAGMAAFCIGALALGGSQFVANASEITSGTWGVFIIRLLPHLRVIRLY